MCTFLSFKLGNLFKIQLEAKNLHSKLKVKEAMLLNFILNTPDSPYKQLRNKILIPIAFE